MPDEAPSSVNFWSHVPSPSNLQSSQSSVLDAIGSAALPIEQLQLKAANLPGLTLPHQLPAPWGTASTDNSPPVLSQAMPAQGSSQTPWLSGWSQNTLQKPTTVQVPNQGNVSERGLKRTCSPDENGEPVDSKLTKRPKLFEYEGCKAGGTNICGRDNQLNGQHAKHDGVLTETKDNNADTGSPNTSSHSSSPETAVIEHDDQRPLPVPCAATDS